MPIRNYLLEPNPRTLNDLEIQDEIYVKIEIGNGQIGGNTVSHDNKVLAKGKMAVPTFVGHANDLQSKEIEVETNILDVNPFTNMCVLTTTFYNQNNKILFTKIDKGEAPLSGVANFKGKYIVKILSLLFAFLFTSSQLMAQEITVQDLETPSSPGFILLDNAPSSIEKPTTPQGFATSLLGFFQGTGGAMEFAPFWLVTHPKLTAEKMYKNKFPIFYNLSVSAATIKSDDSNYFGGGVRTRLFQSYSQKYISKLDSVKERIEDELSKPITELDIDKINQLHAEYSEILSNKPRFTIDMAAAFASESPSNSFSDLAINRWAAWMSFNYRPKGDDFYITLLTRYINNDNFEENGINADLIDIGTRFNYDINKFCISFEVLNRINITDSNYSNYRIAAIGSYEVAENIFITSTFGKNFSEINNIIALAGLNFGFSQTKFKAY
jgi:hypothetical protein